MTQLIADILKRDEEERLRQEATGVHDILPGPDVLYYDDLARRVYDAADAQAGRMAAMRGNPFAVWMGTPPGLDVAEFAMPGPTWDRGEYSAPTARYRVL